MSGGQHKIERRPLRILSPALDIIGRLVELAAKSLRGVSTRHLRVEVAERTEQPVTGIDEASRILIHVLSLYYLALEDMTQGLPVPDERLTPLDGYPPYAPLVWQVRMLREYFRGNEKKAEECRRRRDIALTGRVDVDGHVETSILYEAWAYATLGNLMALKRLLPAFEERCRDKPGWRLHYQLAAGNCHFLRGDYASALVEYERGLAFPDADTHAARVPLVVRVVRSLVALGEFEAARERAEAALAGSAEPLIPSYVDDIELELARAEAGLGNVVQAVERAHRCMMRVEGRGTSGVVLVNFLVESAALAEKVGDYAKFDELTRRVGTLVAGADSSALATQYARLLSMRRMTTFEPLAPVVGNAAPTTLYTAAASGVRTELERCHGPSERSRCALSFLMTYSGAARGFLYVCRSERFDLAASVPDGEPTETLDDLLNEWVSAAFDSAGLTTTASLDEPSAPGTASSFSFVELVARSEGNAVLVAVAALEPSRNLLSRVPSDVLRSIGEELLRTGDSSGKAIFGKSSA